MSRDVLHHILGAVLAVLAGAGLGWWLLASPVTGAWAVAIASAVIWPAREMFQARTRFGRWVMPWHPWWSERRHLEAFAPATAGFALAFAIWLIF